MDQRQLKSLEKQLLKKFFKIKIVFKLINNNIMAKRRHAVGRKQKTSSKKTKKRLEIKRLMLEKKAQKKNKASR